MTRRSKEKAVENRPKKQKKARSTKRATAITKRQSNNDHVVQDSTPDLTGLEQVVFKEEDEKVSLTEAKTHWLFGEWKKLASLNFKTLWNHPDRDRLAIITASAFSQLGNHDKARKYVKTALQWGCPPRVAAQILIAGIHNTLGRAAALKEDDSRLKHHFRAAVDVTTDDTELVSHARSVREMTRLGLLPQAAVLVDEHVETVHDQSLHPNQHKALYKVLKTEVDLLNHELSLAQQRQQIYSESTANTRRNPEGKKSEPERRKELEKHSVSQLGQDIWVLEQTGYKHNGFFVEFGATDGVLLSNTWLLEKEFGWSGICAEPNPEFLEKLKNNRNCIISDSCIGAVTGDQVEFVYASAYSGMEKHIYSDHNAERRTGYLELDEARVSLNTISLHDFLKAHNAPRDIDYISIDTEGSEYEILESFPFDQWRVGLFTIEHNFTDQRTDIRKLMELNGYQCLEMRWDDWYKKDDS